MTRDATTAFARAFVDELARQDVTDAIVCPGSRSAPIALALAEDGRLRVTVVLDERAAAFLALGMGRATGRPALVLTTSGTAAANLHPAVLEAHHGGVPLLVCTADRPPSLRDVGSPQTMDQVRLFGAAVRWFAAPEVPADRPGVGAEWRTLAARAVAATTAAWPGPVHLDLAFRDPLVPTGEALVDAPGRPDGAPFVIAPASRPAPDPTAVAGVAGRLRTIRHGLVVVGPDAAMDAAAVGALAVALGWPVVADPRAGLGAFPGLVPAPEALARATAFAAAHRPDGWIRLGGPLVSAPVTALLDAVPGVIVDPSPVWRDPGRSAAVLLAAAPAPVVAALRADLGAGPPATVDPTWAGAWVDAGTRAAAVQDAAIDAPGSLTEPRLARDLVRAVPSGSALVVASSMPIRDVTAFAPPRADVRVVSNRGLNGIDGFVATALGVAAHHPGPTVALTGDLCFLHDTGGLAAAAGSGFDLVLVVVDNGGGGIFSFLPQAAFPAHFEKLFGTPPGVDLAAVAGACGVPVTPVVDPDALPEALGAAIGAGGVHVLHVRTDRVENVEHHREIWDAVAAEVSRPATPGSSA